MKFLKNHPFAIEAFFDSSLVLTFAVPKAQLQHLIPECLELDLFQNKWGFIAIAMVQTTKLRPKGFPRFMGNDFFLTGYRVFVRFTNQAGKRLRGLYILRSETDKKRMEVLGNIFTHYNYTTTDIKQHIDGDFRTISSKKSNFHIEIDNKEKEIKIPERSLFRNWNEAGKFSGPLPHTFTYDKDDNSILIVQGIRRRWKPKPVNVKSYRFEFLDNLKLEKIILANAFEIKQVPYFWKKGRVERWS